MTAQEAITRVRSLHPDTLDMDEEILYDILSHVDEYIYENIMVGRADAPAKPNTPYYFTDENEDEKDDTPDQLLVPSPYDELYLYRLEAEAHYRQHESKKYANAMALYNQVMFEYKNKYAREHRALPHPPVRYY